MMLVRLIPILRNLILHNPSYWHSQLMLLRIAAVLPLSKPNVFNSFKDCLECEGCNLTCQFQRFSDSKILKDIQRHKFKKLIKNIQSYSMLLIYLHILVQLSCIMSSSSTFGPWQYHEHQPASANQRTAHVLCWFRLMRDLMRFDWQLNCSSSTCFLLNPSLSKTELQLHRFLVKQAERFVGYCLQPMGCGLILCSPWYVADLGAVLCSPWENGTAVVCAERSGPNSHFLKIRTRVPLPHKMY